MSDKSCFELNDLFPFFWKTKQLCFALYDHIYIFVLFSSIIAAYEKKRATSSAQEHVNFDERNMPIFGGFFFGFL